jgi:hypothetical protein
MVTLSCELHSRTHSARDGVRTSTSKRSTTVVQKSRQRAKRARAPSFQSQQAARTRRLHPLEQTHPRGVRQLEEWMLTVSTHSKQHNLIITDIKSFVTDSFLKARSYVDGLAESTRARRIEEGCLAASPEVRKHFPRLREMRDRIWATHRTFLRVKRHGPQQILNDLMRIQRHPARRRYAASGIAYLAYLHEMDREPASGQTVASKPAETPFAAQKKQPRRVGGVLVSVSVYSGAGAAKPSPRSAGRGAPRMRLKVGREQR